MNKTKTLHRVVITGMAGISPLGNDWAAVRGALERNESGIVRMHAWEAAYVTRAVIPVSGGL